MNKFVPRLEVKVQDVPPFVRAKITELVNAAFDYATIAAADKVVDGALREERLIGDHLDASATAADMLLQTAWYNLEATISTHVKSSAKNSLNY